MSIYNYKNGLGHVGSYEVSGIPYLTSSLTVPASSGDPLEISFDTVSKFIIITNTLPGSATNVPLRFGFSANGIQGTNYAVLNNKETFEADLRVTSVFLISDSISACSASVIAGLTGIEAKELPNNWSGSSGVG
jgi:hypothetical protein